MLQTRSGCICLQICAVPLALVRPLKVKKLVIYIHIFLSFYYIFTCMCMHMCGHVHTMTHTSKSEDSLWEFVLSSQDSVGSPWFDYPSATLQWCRCELEVFFSLYQRWLKHDSEKISTGCYVKTGPHVNPAGLKQCAGGWPGWDPLSAGITVCTTMPRRHPRFHVLYQLSSVIVPNSIIP